MSVASKETKTIGDWNSPPKTEKKKKNEPNGPERKQSAKVVWLNRCGEKKKRKEESEPYIKAGA